MQATTKNIIVEKLQSNNLFVLRHYTDSLQPQELAEIINESHGIDVKRVFYLLDREKAVKTFEYLNLDIQYTLLSSYPVEQISQILNSLSPDDRTALFEHIPKETLKNWLGLLSEEEKGVAISLLLYPEDSIGRMMTPDFIEVKQEWTIEKVLDYIRRHGKDSETLDIIYVTDKMGVLIDDVAARSILLAPLDAKVSDLMDSKFVSLSAHDDQEVAVTVFRRNNRVALPVTDFDGILLGIVTIDDLLSIVEEEDTEDIQKLGGTEALDDPYLKVPLLTMIRKRAGWLIILFIGEMLTATAMGFFEGALEKALVLSMFIPLIISSGGNVGSQASTLIIRAMALGEVSITNWWTVIRRELVSGLALGGLLGIIGFLRIFVWTLFDHNTYGPHWFLIALTVSFSVVGVVLWGTLSGSMLPIILKRLGFDPATSSAPFVATMVDVTGLVIYFSFAILFLRGTLL